MSVAGGARADEMALVRQAREGDGNAFGELTGAYRAELRAHCYRMLGSLQDAEDAIQEALLRAWRGLSGFEGRSSVRSWLYSIATNAALDIARHRSRRELPVDFGPAAAPGARLDAPLADPPWLEPCPDQWLADDAGLSPEARYDQRESIELAFVVALQQLPPLQRAVLLLREVVGFSTAEISSQLGTSAPSVNSALQRARAATRRRLPRRSQQSALRALGDVRTRAIAERYADAIERGDAETLISMLTQDATWSMPPRPTWFRGHQAIREFLVRYPLAVRWKHRPTSGNGQLAVGCYLFEQAKACYLPAYIDVLTLESEKIAAVTAFGCSGMAGAELFSRFGLPAELRLYSRAFTPAPTLPLPEAGRPQRRRSSLLL
jgi:RNA polymerase sigma-70 factor, ECF subfamily